MKIRVAKTAGFCFGVRNALEITERELRKHPGEPLCTYGPLIHNRDVIQRLEEKGVRVISCPEETRSGERVVIRAHGIGRQVYEALKQQGAILIDATCPFVKKIHRIVEKHSAVGESILILGNPEHPEVQGIMGWSYSPCMIMEGPEDPIPQFLRDHPAEKCCLVAQTTFHQENFQKIIEKFSKQEYNLCVCPTICSATAEHQLEAVTLAEEVDLMIILGGMHSSNTRKLYDICRERCPHTCHVENAAGLLAYFQENEPTWKLLRSGGFQHVGITAGASTPNYIIQEVVQAMSEMNTFEEMLNESFKGVHSGDIVKGTVVSVTDNEVVINIGYKSDAVMSKEEYSADPNVVLTDEVKVDDELEVMVAKVGDSDILVSRKRLLQNQAYKELEEALENRTVLTGKVSEAFENGAVIFYQNNRVFIPASLLDIHKIDPKSLLGQEVSFRIIRMQKKRGRIMGDRRSVMFDERNAKREETLKKLEVGARMTGTVKNLTNYCAFVDLGGIDGMLHVTEMSWSPVRNPNQVLKVGDTVEVMVKAFDPETKRISLSAKLPENNPWNHVDEKYPVGSIVEGKVVRFADFGAFVSLERGVDGLIHISQLSNKFVKNPADILELGQTVKVKVIDLNMEQKRISLSLRDVTEETPAENESEATEE
ncbi:MAG: bifunctional 4-hydroxy-3-methylbut-2-enyl diphosphate reductase/30S ribosomal protein S1 [Lachnospirales bacterium]